MGIVEWLWRSKMETVNHVRLMVMVDALFDTRLAVLDRLDNTFPDKVLDTKGYHRRLTDEFHFLVPEINTAVFQKAYKERTGDDLANSVMTSMIIQLDKIVTDLERSYVNGDPEAAIPIIEINVFPYVLHAWELEELAEVIKEQVGFICEVNVVRIAYKQINIDFLRNGNYGALIVYDVNEWLFNAMQGLDKHPLGVPHILVVAPALFPSREKVKELEHLRAPNNKPIDPFDALTMQLAELVAMRFIDVAHYSIIYPNENVHEQFSTSL